MSNLFFPIDPGLVSWETTISQGWDVAEAKSAAGRRRTLCRQQYPAWQFAITFSCLNKEERDILLGFFAACKGKWKSFFYKDYTDCYVEGQQLAGNADGSYQCAIPFNGFIEHAEYVDNVKVYINGVETKEFTTKGGRIYLNSYTNGIVTADYEYYWRVCFQNSIEIAELFQDIFKASLTLEVVRE